MVGEFKYSTKILCKNIFLSEGCDSKCGCGYYVVKEDLDGEDKEVSTPGQVVENCALSCTQRSGCTGFEYNHGGDENYTCVTYTGGDNNVIEGSTQSPMWTTCISIIGTNKVLCYRTVILLLL